jgi:release factor glutamine methyltransferase
MRRRPRRTEKSVSDAHSAPWRRAAPPAPSTRPSTDWRWSRPDLRFEPRAALAAGPAGLDDIRRIVAAAPGHLAPGGWLWLEHGFDQAAAVAGLLAEAGFLDIGQRPDLAGILRVSGGRRA